MVVSTSGVGYCHASLHHIVSSLAEVVEISNKKIRIIKKYTIRPKQNVRVHHLGHGHSGGER